MSYDAESLLTRQIKAIRCRLQTAGDLLSPEQMEAKLDQLQALSMELGVMQQARLSELGLGYRPVLETL